MQRLTGMEASSSFLTSSPPQDPEASLPEAKTQESPQEHMQKPMPVMESSLTWLEASLPASTSQEATSQVIRRPRVVLGEPPQLEVADGDVQQKSLQVAAATADQEAASDTQQQQQRQQQSSNDGGSPDASAAVSGGYDEAYEIPEAAWSVYSESEIFLGDDGGGGEGQRVEAGEPATDLTEDDDSGHWEEDLEEAFLRAERKHQSASFGESSEEDCDSHVSFGSQSASQSGRSASSQQRVLALAESGQRQEELENVDPKIAGEADLPILPLDEGSEPLPAFGAQYPSSSSSSCSKGAVASALPSFGPPSASQQRPWSPGRVYAGSRMLVPKEPEDDHDEDIILDAGDSEELFAAEDDRG